MAAWAKEEIGLPNGTRVPAQMPVIVSASRSTDIPAFYADWFMERLKAGYVKWYNPFNGVPLYVSFNKARLFVFWSKNLAKMLETRPDANESPIDVLEREGRNYYFQFTMNDYDAERIEPNVPPLESRIKTLGNATMTGEWNMAAGTCGELADLPGVEHNRCIDDRLMVKCFSHDAELMRFIGAKRHPGDPLFGTADTWACDAYKKDAGQRAACGCVMSKDIGEYDTCPHLCHYCYANTGNAAALANWRRHLDCPCAETITGR